MKEQKLELKMAGSAVGRSPDSPLRSAGTPAGLGRILVIDDDAVVLQALSLKLRREGYEVDGAADPSSALRFLRHGKPVLILLDIHLTPDVATYGGSLSWDGFGMMSWLRRLEEAKHIPIIIITGSETAGFEAKALAEGAAGFFRKPIDYAALLAVIRKTLVTKAQSADDVEAPKPQGAGSTAGLGSELAGNGEGVAKGLAEAVKELQVRLEQEKGAGEARLKPSAELCRRVGWLAARLGTAGVAEAGGLAKALESFLLGLREVAETSTATAGRTAGAALECLAAFAASQGGAKERGLPPAVMVVGNEPDTQRAISRALESVQIKPLQARNPQFAWSLCEANQFDFMVLDLSGPGSDGIELCSRLRASEKHRDTPILIVSTFGGVGAFETSAGVGPTMILLKPLNGAEVVVIALTHLLRRKLAGGVSFQR
jgi:CheY-like chemotaxis protein